MISFRTLIAVCMATLLILTLPVAGHAADYDYIDITNPFLRKIPVAIPAFKKMAPDEATAQVSQQAATLLSQTLEFTGYFKMLDREAFLVDPQADETSSAVRFQNWTAIGAELLITGGVSCIDNLVEMEFRLYDTFKERLLVGKRYKGWLSDQRKMVRRFCSEIIYVLTGNNGYFSSQIAYVSTETGNKEIFICEFDGYNPSQATKTGNITLSPAWSSDGKWLAYTAYASGKPDLFIRHLKEKHGSVVAKDGINAAPAWVPGQFALAATLSFSGDPEIYLLTGTGKIIKRLTNSLDIDISPSWSPDGKKMAFVSRRSGTPQIYIQDVESGQTQRLTFQGRYNTQPRWSPKGDKIAYTAMEKGRSNIWVINANTDNTVNTAVQLTDEGDNESPSWSPDGSLIVFCSNREGPSRIYIMTAFGTDQRRLLTAPGEQTEPSWSPAIID